MREYRVWPAADQRLKRRSVRVLEVAGIDAARPLFFSLDTGDRVWLFAVLNISASPCKKETACERPLSPLTSASGRTSPAGRGCATRADRFLDLSLRCHSPMEKRRRHGSGHGKHEWTVIGWMPLETPDTNPSTAYFGADPQRNFQFAMKYRF